MSHSNEINRTIEEDIKKQLNEINRHVDRTGWPFLIGGIFILFIVTYLIISLFGITTNDSPNSSNNDLQQQVQQLESRIQKLEKQLDESVE